MSEGGWFDSEAIEAERLDADLEQAELERAGARHHRARARSRALRAQGKLAEAAAACPHGWRGPVEPDADGRVTAALASVKLSRDLARRCYECGSVLQELDPAEWSAVRIVAACIFEPDPRA